jgi:hypothetical protein
MKVFKNMVIIIFQNTFTLKMHKNNFLFLLDIVVGTFYYYYYYFTLIVKIF